MSLSDRDRAAEQAAADAFPWRMIGDPPEPSRPCGERHGLSICATGTCVEPCGPTGGCVR